MAFDEDMKKALAEGLALKDKLNVGDLFGKEATSQDVSDGSPRTPGYQPNYGQTMKEQAISNPTQDPSTPAPPSTPTPAQPAAAALEIPKEETKAVAQPVTQQSDFEKALAAAQQQGHGQAGQEQDQTQSR